MHGRGSSPFDDGDVFFFGSKLIERARIAKRLLLPRKEERTKRLVGLIASGRFLHFRSSVSHLSLCEVYSKCMWVLGKKEIERREKKVKLRLLLFTLNFPQ